MIAKTMQAATWRRGNVYEGQEGILAHHNFDELSFHPVRGFGHRVQLFLRYYPTGFRLVLT